MAKKTEKTELPPIDTSKLNGKEHHSYIRDPKTGELTPARNCDATKPAKTTIEEAEKK